MDLMSYLLGKQASGGGGGGGLDWSAIGYSGEPQAIIDGYNYAVEIKNNWDATKTAFGSIFNFDYKLVIMPSIDSSNLTSMISAFYGCYALTTVALFNIENVTSTRECFRECRALKVIPKFNTSKVTNMQQMFNGCYSLTSVPLLDTKAITGNSSFSNMFVNCVSLTDTSLDNILQMCINATGYTGTKTLSTLGVVSTTIYPTSRIEALPHYQDFLDAGWTIGY